jgi:hypothetical protein
VSEKSHDDSSYTPHTKSFGYKTACSTECHQLGCQSEGRTAARRCCPLGNRTQDSNPAYLGFEELDNACSLKSIIIIIMAENTNNMKGSNPANIE